MKAAERIYRLLLHAYPRDFRDEYGQEMSLLFVRGQEKGTSGSGSKCSATCSCTLHANIGA